MKKKKRKKTTKKPTAKQLEARKEFIERYGNKKK